MHDVMSTLHSQLLRHQQLVFPRVSFNLLLSQSSSVSDLADFLSLKVPLAPSGSSAIPVGTLPQQFVFHCDVREPE